MVQVAGPQGTPAYVYRPWNTDDLMAAFRHLPKRERGGAAMTKVVREFVRDFVPTSSQPALIIPNQMSPAQFSTIPDNFTEHLQPSTPGWMNADANCLQADRNCNTWLNDHCTALKDSFPNPCNLSKVNNCTQKEGDPVENCLVHLQTV